MRQIALAVSVLLAATASADDRHHGPGRVPDAYLEVLGLNNRNFMVDTTLPDGSTNPLAGDLGPEGLAFIPVDSSPNHRPLLVVGNEVSGTTTIYELEFRR